MRLTDTSITNEKYKGEPFEDAEGRTQWPPHVVWDDELEGFGVRIYPSFRGRPSRKDFIVTWRVALKSRTMAIGTFGKDCTLRQARRVAREAIELARRGRDPLEARQQALGIGTAEDLASRFLYEHTSAKKKPAAPAESPATEPGLEPSEGVEPPAAGDAVAADAHPADAEPESIAGGSTVTEPMVAESTALEPMVVAPTAPEPEPPEPKPAEPTAAQPTTVEPAVVDSAAASEPLPAPDTAPAPPAPAEPEPAVAHGASAAQTAPPREAAPEARTSPQAPRRSLDSPARPRGPTKVRLMSIPEPLYRDIELRARESGMTMSRYLRSLVDRELSLPTAEEVFSRIEARQTVEVAKKTAESPTGTARPDDPLPAGRE